MKFEIALVRAQHQALGFPLRACPGEGQDPSEDIPALELMSRRRAVRTATDALIEHGLMGGDLPALSVQIGCAMTAVAGSCAQVGMEPSISDFLDAARELVADARIVWDKGVHLKEWEQARIGAAMIEIVCHGIAATLGIPYQQVFESLHRRFVAQELEPDMAEIRAILRRAGHEAPEPGPSDTEPTAIVPPPQAA